MIRRSCVLTIRRTRRLSPAWSASLVSEFSNSHCRKAYTGPIPAGTKVTLPDAVSKVRTQRFFYLSAVQRPRYLRASPVGLFLGPSRLGIENAHDPAISPLCLSQIKDLTMFVVREPAPAGNMATASST